MPNKGRLSSKVDLAKLDASALRRLPAIAKRWFPDGRLQGKHWVAKGKRLGSQKPYEVNIDLQTCRWIDYRSGNKGMDAIDLACFVADISFDDAVKHLARMLELR